MILSSSSRVIVGAAIISATFGLLPCIKAIMTLYSSDGGFGDLMSCFMALFVGLLFVLFAAALKVNADEVATNSAAKDVARRVILKTLLQFLPFMLAAPGIRRRLLQHSTGGGESGQPTNEDVK